MIYIEKILKQHGLRNKALIEEYADHYYCHYDTLKSQGIPHGEIEKLISSDIANINFKRINRNYFFLYYKSYIKLMALFLLIVTFYLSTFTFSTDPPNIAPILTYKPDDISSHYGHRIHPIKKIRKLHTGIDIKAQLGTPIVATSDGIIKDLGFHKGYGYFIEIEHDKQYSTRYHHLSDIIVTKNQKIKKGEKIGAVGSSGLSVVPHLHYEVILNGAKVDPKDYLKV